MKNVYKFLLVLVAVISFVTFNGCDLEELPINIPMTKEFPVNGTLPVSRTETINFADFPEYQDYEDDISSISYVDAALRTVSINRTDITADITIQVSGGGVVLFNKVISGVNPADYLTQSYPIDLTTDQITAINAYLAISSNRTFTGTVTVSGATGSVTAVIAVDFLLEAMTKTN